MGVRKYMSEIVNWIKKDIKNFYYSKIKHMTEQQIKQEHLRKIGMNRRRMFYFFGQNRNL